MHQPAPWRLPPDNRAVAGNPESTPCNSLLWVRLALGGACGKVRPVLSGRETERLADAAGAAYRVGAGMDAKGEPRTYVTSPCNSSCFGWAGLGSAPCGKVRALVVRAGDGAAGGGGGRRVPGGCGLGAEGELRIVRHEPMQLSARVPGARAGYMEGVVNAARPSPSSLRVSPWSALRGPSPQARARCILGALRAARHEPMQLLLLSARACGAVRRQSDGLLSAAALTRYDPTRCIGPRVPHRNLRRASRRPQPAPDTAGPPRGGVRRRRPRHGCVHDRTPASRIRRGVRPRAASPRGWRHWPRPAAGLPLVGATSPRASWRALCLHPPATDDAHAACSDQAAEPGRPGQPLAADGADDGRRRVSDDQTCWAPSGARPQRRPRPRSPHPAPICRASSRRLNPAWNLVGRVHFNPAENRRDPDAPFAFMATYTTRLSAQARAQHLPLGEALRAYSRRARARAGNREQLLALLLPVRSAPPSAVPGSAGWSTVAISTTRSAGVPRTKPRALLGSAADLEAAGHQCCACRLAGLPAGRRARACIGDGRQHHAILLGLAGLLDFEVAVTLETARITLTEAEIRALLATTDGLALLRGRWVELDREALQRTYSAGFRMPRRWRRRTWLSRPRPCACWPAPASPRMRRPTPIAAGVGVGHEAGPWLAETLRTLRAPEEAGGGGRPRAGAAWHAAPASARRRAMAASAVRPGAGRLPRRRHGARGKTIQVLALLLACGGIPKTPAHRCWSPRPHCLPTGLRKSTN